MYKLFLLFFLTNFAFSQSEKNNLVENIYNATETFSANTNAESLKILEQKEKTFQPKTKTEFLAMVYLLCNKSFYFKNNNQSEKAISNYEKAWQLFQKNAKDEPLQTYDIIEYCLKPLGNLYTIIGDYENAENVIKQYFYIANKENNQPHKFSAILNLTNVFYYSGKNQEAINLLEKTIKTEKLTDSQKGILWNSLGNNYLNLNKNNVAEKCYKISIQLLKNANDTASLSNSYKNIALLNNDVALFQKAKEIFLQDKNHSPREIAKWYLDEAILNFKNDKIEEAQNAIFEVYQTLIPNYYVNKSSLPSNNSLYSENTFIDALDLQAQIFLAKNQPKKALESYALSFHVDELLQSLLVYENSKIISQINNRNRTEKCLAIYYSLYQKEKKISYLEKAFSLQEASKSAVLKQAVFNKKNSSVEEKRILEQLQNWNTIIVKEQQKLEYADISKINEAIKKQNELMLLLKSIKSKESVESKELDIKTLYSKLENDKAILVEYFFGNENLYVFSIENKTIKLQLISKSDLATPQIVQFLDYFSDAQKIVNDVSGYNHYANVLYQLLKLPSKSTSKNLIIVPDGILTFLPFEALITKESTTTNFSKMHYLLKEYAIGYNNSATFYLNTVPFQHSKETVLGVFPIFENTPLELSFSKKELANLKEKFEGKYLEKRNATFQNFKNEAMNYSILHLSTHASSGDIVEPASIRFDDGEILYSEMYNLKINPNLVVLSACETGLGKLYKSEGAMSVARGFQFAGAQNLLFSLWKVNDFTTSVLMEKFYKNLKKGNSYFDANHQAKIDFLNDFSIPIAKKSPYYWSAFVYYGSVENSHSNTNYLLWSSGCIGLILLVLFLYYKRHKRKVVK